MKKLLALLLAVLMVVSLAGCTKPDTPDTPTEPTKITIWGTWSDAQKAALEKYAADFNAAHPEYVVVYEGQVSQGFAGACQNAVVANAGPDMIIDYASTAATYLELGKAVDLSKRLPADTIAQLTEGALAEATSYVEDGMYNFPIILSGPVLWVNTEILKVAGVEVPTTWDELWVAAKTISEKVTVVTGADGGKTFVTDGSGEHIYGFASDSHTDIANTWILQAGGQVMDETTGDALFNTPAFATILQKYADGITDKSLLPGATTDYLSTDFNSGIVAMYYGSVAGQPYIGQYTKNPVPGIVAEAAKVPTTAGGTPWTSAWNRGVLVFDYKDEARINGAVEFLKYLISPEINTDWCKAANYQTCLKWTMDNADYKAFLETNATLACLEPEIAGALPALPAQTAVRNALKNLITAVGSGVAVDQALTEAVQYVVDNK